jgi:hypothetical protein
MKWTVLTFYLFQHIFCLTRRSESYLSSLGTTSTADPARFRHTRHDNSYKKDKCISTGFKSCFQSCNHTTGLGTMEPAKRGSFPAMDCVYTGFDRTSLPTSGLADFACIFAKILYFNTSPQGWDLVVRLERGRRGAVRIEVVLGWKFLYRRSLAYHGCIACPPFFLGLCLLCLIWIWEGLFTFKSFMGGNGGGIWIIWEGLELVRIGLEDTLLLCNCFGSEWNQEHRTS